VEANVSPEEPCLAEGLEADKSGDWDEDLAEVEAAWDEDIFVVEEGMDEEEIVCCISVTVVLRTEIASALAWAKEALAWLISSTFFSNFSTEPRKELAIVLDTVLKDTEI
jgi:hypothetical protein